MPTLKPLDAAAIRRAANQTGAILTLEEHCVSGGLGTAVAEVLADAGLPVRFRRMGTPDQPYHMIGSQRYLQQHLIGDAVAAARQLLRERVAV
jgi:transketolase